MRIGVFGGTFDPPHIGHLILAMEAMHQLELDTVLWVLTPKSPFKSHVKISPLEQRLDLVEAAIADEPAFQISRVDIDRPPPYFALDTICLLREQYPRAKLFFLMGEDSLHDLPGWYQPAALVEACDTLGVMHRSGDQVDLNELEKKLPGVIEKVRFFDTPRIEISAQNIRERIFQEKPYRYFIPPQVYNRITQRGYFDIKPGR